MYTKSYCLLFAVLAIFAASQAQTVSFGKCPSIKIQQNFTLPKYLGKWFEYAKYPNVFEQNGICNQAQYKRVSEHIVQVNNTMFDLSTRNFTSFLAYADVIDSGRLNLVLPNSSYQPGKANYIVLETDYSNYSVVYSCEQAAILLNVKFAWILTRERSPNATIVEKAMNVLKVNKIPTKDLKTVEQKCT